MIEPDDEKTGLPILGTWRRAYVAVLLALVSWILLLAALDRCFA